MEVGEGEREGGVDRKEEKKGRCVGGKIVETGKERSRQGRRGREIGREGMWGEQREREVMEGASLSRLYYG